MKRLLIPAWLLISLSTVYALPDMDKAIIEKAAPKYVAEAALEAELKKRGIESNDFRILGYNGPGVPNDKKTWEMLAVLPAEK